MNKDNNDGFYSTLMDIIEEEKLKNAYESYNEYKVFELDELKLILGYIKRKLKRKQNIISRINLLLCLVFGVVCSRLLPFPENLIACIIFEVIMILTWYKFDRSVYKEVDNFLDGRCILRRDENMAIVQVDGFELFTVELNTKHNS